MKRSIKDVLASLNNREKEVFKFCIVGGSSALIDLIIYNIFLLFSPYQVSVVFGFAISWLYNYYLSSHWTFKEKPTAFNFVGMLLAHLFNLFVVRMGVMYFFVDILDINPRIAYIPTLIIAAITSYFLVRFSFKHRI